jgi:hypothetical protein
MIHTSAGKKTVENTPQKNASKFNCLLNGAKKYNTVKFTVKFQLLMLCSLVVIHFILLSKY